MDDVTASRGAFEAFNARFLTSEEVARSFIPPPQYDRLVEIGHSVLLGPRGSGKTTLLKMLQLRSLASWKDERASEIRRNLGYHSIFLGTDVLWGSQLDSRTKGIADDEKRGQIRRTSFRLHLALAFLNALEECWDEEIIACGELSRFTLEPNRALQSELIKGISAIWQLDPTTDSLLGLRIGLQMQLSKLLSLTSALRRDSALDLPDFVDLDPMSALISAIDITNAAIGQPNRRWAVLCDELEIAPAIIRQDLLQLLRSTSHKILFKFSLFPYSSELAVISAAEAPTSSNDYEPIELYYSRREQAYEFCEAMLRGMVEGYGAGPHDTSEGILGDGWFDGGRGHRRSKHSPYSPPDGEFYVRARQLAKVDPSFRSWLSSQKFDLESIGSLPENSQATYRKALPSILIRTEFLTEKSRLRPRKALNRLYTGAYSLFSIAEGNPRVFINLIRPLVKEYVQTGTTVTRETEASSIDVTIHRFLASLSAIPTNGHGNIRSILQLISVVGGYFRDRQLELGFSPEPHGSFTVDDAVPEDIVKLVGRTLNSGGFVHLPENPSDIVHDLRGQRFRLAFTLMPEFKLPLVVGRSVKLSNILRGAGVGRKRQVTSLAQVRLPFGVDE